jgi:hypothetical protein
MMSEGGVLEAELRRVRPRLWTPVWELGAMRYILGRALPGLDRLLPSRPAVPPPLPVSAKPSPRDDAPGRAEAEVSAGAPQEGGLEVGR